MTDTNCDHPIEKISNIDIISSTSRGVVQIGDQLYTWGECECGQPTIVTATIESVELDTEGSVQHLEEYAHNNER